MDQTFCVRGLQTFRHLDCGLQNFRFGKLLPLFDGIVETPLIDQLHDKIKLPVVASERENFYDVRMINRSGDARFLLQLRGVTRFGVPAQKFQRDEAVQRGVARFVDRTHSADTERFDKNEIIKRAFDAKLFATLGDMEHARAVRRCWYRLVPHKPDKIALARRLRSRTSTDINIRLRWSNVAQSMSEPTELQVPSRGRGMRLDRFLADELPHFSRSRLQALIREGHVTLNEKTARPREILRTGDMIRLVEPPPEKIATEPENIPLDILFEDDDLLVINKPAGMVVHPGAGNTSHTLVNALLAHCRTLSWYRRKGTAWNRSSARQRNERLSGRREKMI